MIQQREWTAHEDYWLCCGWPVGVCEYDPAEDGPECGVITRILAFHDALDPKLPNWLGKAGA